MLQSTADLLIRIHNFFDEIDYNPSSEDYDPEDVLDKVIFTINHSKELDDALYVAREFAYYLKKEDKFIKKYCKYPEFWDMIEYSGREEVAVVSDDESIGSYYITNIYGENYKDVYITGQAFPDDLFIFKCEDGYFSFGEDSDYYLHYAKLSSTKMVLADKDRKNIATIVLSKDYGIFLENNKTRYELAIYESGIAFFNKEYYDSLNGEEPDLDKECKGFIQWDILDKNSEYGLSRLDVYDEDADINLMVSLAASCFLVFRSYIKGSHSYAGVHAAIAANMIIRRH